MEKKSNHLVGSIICGLLTAFGFVASIISLIGGSKGIWVLIDCILLAISVLIAYYAFAGYKKPHGNLLKYIILIRVIPFVIGMPVVVPLGDKLCVTLEVIEVGLSCYIAGRLDRVKENSIFMVLVMICTITGMVSQIISGVATIGVASGFIIWLDICVAYFLRYKEHKEAGLADAPKK